MRNLKLISVITLLVVLFVSVGGAIAAENQVTTEATVTATLSSYSVSAGGSLTVAVTVQNTVSTQFQIMYLGLHGDWMETDGFYGANLQNNPPTLASAPYQGSFLVTIPVGTTIGTHSYYVGVDAVDSSGNYYSWNSNVGSIQVIPAGATTGTTTPTSGPTQNGDGSEQTTDYLFYIAIIAIVVMVVLVFFVILTLRKRSRPRIASSSIVMPPQTQPEPKPQAETEAEPEPETENEAEQPPAKEKPSQGENFDI